MSKSQETIIQKWQESKQHLNVAKLNEGKLRGDVVAKCFDDLDVGVNTFEMESGEELKATVNETFKVDPSFPPEWATSAVIRVKYEVDKKEYNKLTVNQKKELQRWITITPGKPQLKVV